MGNKKQGPLRKASTVLLAALLSISCCPASLAFAEEPGNAGESGTMPNEIPESSGSPDGADPAQDENVKGDALEDGDAGPNSGAESGEGGEPEADIAPLSTTEAIGAEEGSSTVDLKEADAEEGVIAEGTFTVGRGTYKLEKEGDQITLTFTFDSESGDCSPDQDVNQEWLVPLSELPAGPVKVILSEGIKTFGQYVFGKGPNPSYIGWSEDHPIDLVLPSTLTSIGRNGIDSSLPVASITVTGGGCQLFDGSFLFENAAHTKILKSVVKSGDITIPEGTKEVQYNCFPAWQYGTLTIPASLTALAASAFAGATAIECSFDKIIADPANTAFYVEDDPASDNYGSLCNKSSGALVLKATMPGTVQDASGVSYTADYSKLVSAPSNLAGAYTVNASCTSVLPGAFNNCAQLESVDMANVETIVGGSTSSKGSSEFFGCAALTEVNAPHVTTVGRYVFAGLGSLSTISLPKAEKIDLYAFDGCSSLTALDLPEVTSIGNYAFRGTGLASITFPKLQSIGTGSFSGCALESAVLPSTLTSLGSSAFSNCGSLKSADISATNLATLGTSFANCPKLETLQLPASMQTINAGALANCTSLSSLDLSSTQLTIIGGTASTAVGVFEGCSSLTEVKLPNTVATLGSSTFKDCASLVSCDLSNIAITQLAASLFAGCSDLQQVKLPAAITSFGTYVFQNCTSLESFKVPEGIKDLPHTFAGCTSLTSVELPSSITTLTGSFNGCTSLSGIDLPASLTAIGANAFSGCSALSALVLPENVATIGANAFARCASLGELAIPDGVTDIGAGALYGLSLSSIKMPANLFKGLDASKFTTELQYGDTAIGRTSPLFISTFSEDQEGSANNVLKDVDLSSYEQTYLPTFMFAGCTALSSVAIPGNVNSIMGGAFLNCTSLNDVYYYGDPSNIAVFETQEIKHSFGYSYIGAGAFSVPNGLEPGLGTTYKTMEGLSFYGLGISENNALKDYAEKTNCAYVPFAFLGGGGSSADAMAKFGYANPDNTVSIEGIEAGGTPKITLGYPFDAGMSRTLVPGEDCTVVYTLNGREVSDLSAPGTYTATISGDGESVWGTATATFTVTVSNVAMHRLGGEHRYGTMALVSQAAFADAGTCPTVVIARGDNFPDALAAAGLAGIEGGQVLLTETSTLTAETRAEIARLGAVKAYVIGDEYSVTARTFNEIKSLVGGNATRLGGENRLDTAVKIYEAGGAGWGKTAIVATGEKAADSLSISAVAYALEAPIFLADKSGTLPQSALDAIAKGGFANVLVLGDKYSVSAATFDKLQTLAGSVERIGGTDRYDTSLRIGQWALSNGFACSKVAITAGREGKFADALVASSLGGRATSPLLLVDEGGTACIDKLLANNRGRIGSVYVLGDRYTVSDALYEAVRKAVS